MAIVGNQRQQVVWSYPQRIERHLQQIEDDEKGTFYQWRSRDIYMHFELWNTLKRYKVQIIGLTCVEHMGIAKGNRDNQMS